MHFTHMTDEFSKPQNCLNFKARKLARLLSRFYDEELAKAKLKTTQFTLLCHVKSHEPISSTSLARLMGLDASTLTRNIQPLLTAEYLKVDVGIDARSRIVTLTSAGREKQLEAEKYWVLAQNRICGILGNEHFAVLSDLMDKGIATLLLSDE